VLNASAAFPRQGHAHQMRIGPGTYIYGDEIFEGLTHLQPLNVQVTGVKEVVDPGVAFVISLQTKIEHDFE
jgi:hypothetical protein